MCVEAGLELNSLKKKKKKKKRAAALQEQQFETPALSGQHGINVKTGFLKG